MQVVIVFGHLDTNCAAVNKKKGLDTAGTTLVTAGIAPNYARKAPDSATTATLATGIGPNAAGTTLLVVGIKRSALVVAKNSNQGAGTSQVSGGMTSNPSSRSNLAGLGLEN